MNIWEIIGIALGLAMDAFAVSVAAGTQGYAKQLRSVLRLAFHLGLFQFLMPVIGWYVGNAVDQWVKVFDHWVAFGLLAFVGSRMVYAGIHPGVEAKKAASDPTRRWSLVLVSVATSIDALAIGFSLAMIRVNIWYPSVVIGVVTASLSVAGLRLGRWVGEQYGQRMEVVGGLILWFIGGRILLSHFN